MSVACSGRFLSAGKAQHGTGERASDSSVTGISTSGAEAAPTFTRRCLLHFSPGIPPPPPPRLDNSLP